MTRISLTALALAAFAAATPAFSAPLSVWGDDERITAKVSYDTADLRSADGAARIAFRIRIAARQVCGGGNPLVASGARFQHCQHQSIDQALATLNAPLVADALGRTPATTLAASH
jgi:UrcA family protein